MKKNLKKDVTGLLATTIILSSFNIVLADDTKVYKEQASSNEISLVSEDSVTSDSAIVDIAEEKLAVAVKFVPYQNVFAVDDTLDYSLLEIVEGKLPEGMQIVANNDNYEIYGVPKENGEFNVIIKIPFKNGLGYKQVKMTLCTLENTEENIQNQSEGNLKIIQYIEKELIDTLKKPIDNQTLEIDYDYGKNKDKFAGVWIDGKQLTEEKEYTIDTESDKTTKIVIKNTTIGRLGMGTHTVAVLYKNIDNQIVKAVQNYSYEFKSDHIEGGATTTTNGSQTNNGNNNSGGNHTIGGGSIGGGTSSGSTSSGGTSSRRTTSSSSVKKVSANAVDNTIYKISYESNGGSKVVSQDIKKGKKIIFFATPAKEGYKFIGWYTDKELTKEYNKNQVVNSSFTLYAKYEPINCKIWFDTNGGSVINSVSIKGDSKLDLANIAKATKDGYTFAGWYTDKNLSKFFDENTNITSNLVLYAKWKENVKSEQSKTVGGFKDVDSSNLYYDDINWAYDNKIMVGYNNEIFAPNDLVLASNFVTALAKMSGDDFLEAATYGKISGVSENVWYTNYVKWAKINGIIDDEFIPNEKISRENMVDMLLNFLNYKNNGIDFSDVNTIFDGTKKDYVTRAEFAGVLRKIAEKFNL